MVEGRPQCRADYTGRTREVAVLLMFLTGITMATTNRTAVPANVTIVDGKWFVGSNETQSRLLKQARTRCIQDLMARPFTNETVCFRTFDNVSCWHDAKPGEVLSQPCPNYIHDFRIDEVVTRTCTVNGTWRVNPKTGEPGWSNYSRCLGTQNTLQPLSKLFQEHVPKITLLSNIGYGVSLSALVVAVFIMLFFRKLYCPRNTLHLNLFLSFILRALMSFLRQNLFINNLGLSKDVRTSPNGHVEFWDKYALETTHWECKTVTFIFMYSLSANYVWIFMEGLYLHNLIFVSVFSEKSTIRWYIVFGWLTPLTFLLPWSILRAKKHNVYCWNISDIPGFEWTIKGPLLLLVLINFGFFINVVRILFTKLRASNTREGRRYRYIKLAKSTLVLIPLFGVHYILFSLIPEERVSDMVGVVKLYFEMICNSFQGFLVALLYCFLNGEVQSEISRKNWHRFQFQKKHRSKRSDSSSKIMHTNGLSAMETSYPSTRPVTTHGNEGCDVKDAHHQMNGDTPKTDQSNMGAERRGVGRGERGHLLLEGNDDCFVSESGVTEIMCFGDSK